MPEETSFYQLTDEENVSLQELLREYDIKNCTKTIKTALQKGDNFLGNIQNIVIKTGNRLQLDLMLKCSVREGPFITFLPHNKMFQREIFMYETYLPALYKIQRDNHLENGLQLVPKIYKSCPVERKEFILMENMKSLGYEMLDRRNCLNLAHCKLVLHQLANFHGLGFVLKHTQGKLFQNMTRDKQESIFESSIFNNSTYTVKVQEMLTRASETLDPIVDATILNRFDAYKKVMVKWMQDLERPELKDDYCVIVHNDCWINNLLFKYEKADDAKSNPERLCIIDWQMSNINSPVKDVSYFLYQCTDPEFLTTNFHDLINYYYHEVTQCIAKCGLNIDTLYPWDVFQRHLKRYMRHGVHYLILTGALHLSNEHEIPNHTADTGDMEYSCDNFNISGANDYLYNLRVRGVLRHAILHGFL